MHRPQMLLPSIVLGVVIFTGANEAASFAVLAGRVANDFPLAGGKHVPRDALVLVERETDPSSHVCQTEVAVGAVAEVVAWF